MKAIITGFGVSKLNADYNVIFTKEVKIDGFTGVKVESKHTLLCAKHFHFKDFVGKECDILTSPSPNLKQNVVIDIKEVK